ncbi:hypothetical protein ACJRO7_023236 [Eucalyptus globulus]|uniref:MORF/ORRM1/DAG-like MORF domain-containing protein n=1 Tax=Eucalyptus globulus TaxID=34317 RepID=A0ABD3K6Y9_EUCGL
MATKLFTRSRLLSMPQRGLASLLSRSRYFSSAPASAPRYPPFLPSLLRYRLRPLSAASAEFHGRLAAASSARAFATRATSSWLNDQGPNRWNQHLHFAIMLKRSDDKAGEILPDDKAGEILDTCVKFLAGAVGGEEKARSKIYTIDTGPYYFAFGVNVFPKLAFKLAGLPRVRWVVVDAYLPLRKGETAIFGPTGVYEWNGHDDQPRNFNRSRNFERRENMQNRNFLARDMPPIHNQGMQNPPPLGIMLPPNMGTIRPPPNMGGGMPPPSNFGGMPLHNQM